MPITIIVGGQYGSEGKGKVAHYFTNDQNASCVVRVGGPNSGHTIYHLGKKEVLRQLSVASFDKSITSVIAAGSYIDLEIIKEEIHRTGSTPNNLLIDPNAVIISECNKLWEDDLTESIGSTGSGVGESVGDRVQRNPSSSDSHFANDDEYLKPFIGNTKKFLRDCLNDDKRIIIEGTQGYGLSVLHSKEYPYVTSRDTTASGFLSEVGLSPLDVDDIILVIRRYPIRVAGNSGSMKNEITWKKVSEKAGKEIIEYTSVTQKIRRVAEFNPEVVIDAIVSNNPTKIVLNHLDYDKSGERKESLKRIEDDINRKIDYIGVDPYGIVRRNNC